MSEIVLSSTDPIPAFHGSVPGDLGEAIGRAVSAWLLRTPSPPTRKAYEHDLNQFLVATGIKAGAFERLPEVRPEHVSAWREKLAADTQTNSTIRRKLTALRSLFSYLQTYGYSGANPAHGDFVSAPSVARDGKTVGLSPNDCRRLLDAPSVRKTIIPKRRKGSRAREKPPVVIEMPVGIRDRAMLAVLAYSGCRLGELVRLRVRDYKQSGEHRILNIIGKGGKERTTPLHLEAVERLGEWLAVPGVKDDPTAPLFPAARSPRGMGRDGFASEPMTTRAVEKLIGRYVKALKLDAAVTVHSLRVTALTTARERGSDIIDLQDFAGHADPRTTLTYIRSRDRLSKRPAYVLKY